MTDILKKKKKKELKDKGAGGQNITFFIFWGRKPCYASLLLPITHLTICSFLQAINAESRIIFFHLSSPYFSHSVYWIHSTVLRQGHGDYLQGICKSSHGILFQGWALGKNIKRHLQQLYKEGKQNFNAGYQQMSGSSVIRIFLEALWSFLETLKMVLILFFSMGN